MKLQGIKNTMVAAALTALTAFVGTVGQAHAFTFGDGDLVLAIYGNNSEALYNIGKFTDLLANGASLNKDVSSGLTQAKVGTNPVSWTVFGWDTSLPAGQVHAATKANPIQPAGTFLGLTNQFNPLAVWSGTQLNTADVIPKADGDSFSSRINSGGDGLLSGAWPNPMEGALSDTLTVVRGDVAANTFTQVGRVTLTDNGQLTLLGGAGQPVPLPAGMVLFGTGVIGLIGVARRSVLRVTAYGQHV